MRPKLVLVAGKADKAEIRLKLPTIVGRTHDAGLMIAHKTVSRRHCELFERHGMLFVRDTGSRNGTLVDNSPIKKEAMVKPGHTVTIGPLTFRADYEPADSFMGADEPEDAGSNGASAGVSPSSATVADIHLPEEATRDMSSAEAAPAATITQSEQAGASSELEFEEFSADDLADFDAPSESANDDELAAAIDTEDEPAVSIAATDNGAAEEDVSLEFSLDDLGDLPADDAPAAVEDEVLSIEIAAEPAAAADELGELSAGDDVAAFDLSEDASPAVADAKADDNLDALLDEGELAFDLDDLGPATEETAGGDDLGFTLEDLEEPSSESAPPAPVAEEEDAGLTFDLEDSDAAEPEAEKPAAKPPAKEAGGKVQLGEEKGAGGDSEMSRFMKELGL